MKFVEERMKTTLMPEKNSTEKGELCVLRLTRLHLADSMQKIAVNEGPENGKMDADEFVTSSNLSAIVTTNIVFWISKFSVMRDRKR